MVELLSSIKKKKIKLLARKIRGRGTVQAVP